LATGKVNVPFPVETDMVMAALGMAEYEDPKTGKYELKRNERQNTIELIQDTVSPSGQQVKRVTVFRGTLAKPGEPQVLEHTLRDARGNLICRANVQRVETDRGSGGVYPTRVTIEWPAQSVGMKMHLTGVQVNKIDKDAAARMFTMSGTEGYGQFDLARGALVSGGNQRQASAEPRR
jgi:hypothetical protein